VVARERRLGGWRRDAIAALLWIAGIVPAAMGFWLVAGSLAGVPQQQVHTLVAASFLSLALATLLQVAVGYRLPMYEGPAAAYLAAITVVSSQGHHGLRAITGGLLAAGGLVALLGILRVDRLMTKVFTPVVANVFLLTVTLAILPVTLERAVAATDGLPGRAPAWAATLVVLAVALGMRRVARLTPYIMLVALVLGTATYIALAGAPHVTVDGGLAGPGLLPWGAPEASAGVVLPFLLAGALAAFNTVATGAAVAVALWVARPDYPAWPAAVLIAVAILIGVGASLARFARSSGEARKRLEWLGWSLTTAAGATVLVFGLRALVDWPPATAEVAAAITIVIPMAIAASASHRLRSAIDGVLTATISLAGLTAVVIAVYLAIVLGLGRVPRDSERTLLVLSMAAAGMAALLYLPAHRRLRDFAFRLVYGEQSAPDDVIRNFGSRLSRSIPLDELLLQMVESLRKTFDLSSAEVWRASGGTLTRTVSDPERGPAELTVTEQEEQTVARAGVSGPAWVKVWLPNLLEGRGEADLRVAPITHSGELLGLIVAERPEGAQAFDSQDENTLAELARQVGLTLHNVRLDSALQESLDEVRRQAQALQASRARIVAAGDLQRRRIERNLHDGAQQHLVALAVKVRLVRQLTDRDPAKAAAMLEELASDVEDTIQELRDLAHGIYPPLLADKGLPEALASAARRSTVPTTVDAAGIGRYPADAEAAVYFCCLEALQNTAKHGGEGVSASIRVWVEEGALLFEVADDGAGFDVRQQGAGAGFTNMNDRLGAIGGSLRVESTPGRGTRILGTIPVRD
jgi:signal transduction histidine kinase